MQLSKGYPCTYGLGSALTLCCSVLLYLVKSIACQPYVTQTMMPNASYYRNGNIYCLKCPAGNFVKKDCVIPYTQGICHMCDPGVTYSEYPNGLNRCLTCTQCRADQDVALPCNITKNTLCQCKGGTYCPPDSPCSQCLPCRSSCPEGQVLQRGCNATSDIVCVTVTSQLSATIWIISALSIIFIIGCSAVCFCYVRKSRHRKEKDESSTPKSIEEKDSNTNSSEKLLPR